MTFKHGLSIENNNKLMDVLLLRLVRMVHYRSSPWWLSWPPGRGRGGEDPPATRETAPWGSRCTSSRHGLLCHLRRWRCWRRRPWQLSTGSRASSTPRWYLQYTQLLFTYLKGANFKYLNSHTHTYINYIKDNGIQLLLRMRVMLKVSCI